jgi:hypothetical protein
MLWIKKVFVRRDAPTSRMRQIFAVSAALTASLPIPDFAADLASGKGPASSASLPAFTWTGLYIGANAGAWFAPTNPSYEAIGALAPPSQATKTLWNLASCPRSGGMTMIGLPEVKSIAWIKSLSTEISYVGRERMIMSLSWAVAARQSRVCG